MQAANFQAILLPKTPVFLKKALKVQSF